MKPSPLVQEFFAAAQDRDPKSKVQKLRESIKKHEGSPTNYLFYAELLATAEAAGLGADEVGGLAGPGSRKRRPTAKPGSRRSARRR